MKNKEIDKQKVFDLIEQITPHNNRYRDLVKSSEGGTEILILMWKVGETIESFIKEQDVKPHNLYWQIYGKAEGLKISYITRDFLSYCLRIKKYFPNTSDISNRFPNLQKYTLFREAFLLLENLRFKLSQDEEMEIIKVLNSKNEPQKILIAKIDHLGDVLLSLPLLPLIKERFPKSKIHFRYACRFISSLLLFFMMIPEWQPLALSVA